jgi:cytoplasmic iron level regulating protein YaaA (DUF328/UPF0246 family)
MIILLSPAKTMHLIQPMVEFNCEFKEDALKMRSSLALMSVTRLKTFFNISLDMANKVREYYQSNHTYRVYDLFDGIGYRILKSLTPTIPKHIYALSGLYGLLHLSDTVYPYRLDLNHPKKGSLLTFWRKKLYERLKHEHVIIACLSSEYDVLLDERLPVIYVKIYKNNKKAPSVDAKKVRAAFAVHLDTYGLDHSHAFEYIHYKVTHVSHNHIQIESQ